MMRLWRPVGPVELQLIEGSAWKAFPPRLPDQPIFYPVCNQEYAEQISRDWNSSNAAQDYLGYVTEFDMDDDYIVHFQEQVVGGSNHKELWVPAEQLTEFNDHVVGNIRVVSAFKNRESIPV